MIAQSISGAYEPGELPATEEVPLDVKSPMPRKLTTEGITSFLHVEDAANAALIALDWPLVPVNIVDDEPAKRMEWLPVYADALGAPKPDIEPSSNRGERGASNAKAQKDYGRQPLYPTWRKGFAKSLENYN